MILPVQIEIEGEIKYVSEKKKGKSRSEVPKIRHAIYLRAIELVSLNSFFFAIVIRLRQI